MKLSTFFFSPFTTLFFYPLTEKQIRFFFYAIGGKQENRSPDGKRSHRFYACEVNVMYLLKIIMQLINKYILLSTCPGRRKGKSTRKI